jgi:23S rRNA (cytosine1962-C5)-methyltransferase
MTIWKLNQGADRRIRARHPWVFSNELSQSPKGHPPGKAVRLLDSRGQFVASGYGNPHSLIAFRALSFDPHTEDPTSLEELVSKTISAWGQRQVCGYELSFRLVYGESDFLPGLVIDRYLVEQQGKQFQVFACQVLTAGMQVALHHPEAFFRRLVEETNQAKLSEVKWEDTAIVLRNDVQIRRLEGLEVEEARAIKQVESLDLRNAEILIDAVAGEEPIKMNCDLLDGQKTGFFLDQAFNIRLLCEQIARNQYLQSPVRILDLCCYVGQWSTQLTRMLKHLDLKTEVTAVDVSKPALQFAEKNISREGGQVFIQEKNVLEELNSFPDKHYDIVIADPPAFIKAKKDIPTGKHAYLKLNTNAFRLVKRGGYVVSCSCSGLLEEQELMDTLAKSIRRQELDARCIQRGGHAADHPNIMSFPEGFYLKMFLHQVAFE